MQRRPMAADARSDIVRIAPNREQQIITQKLSGHFEGNQRSDPIP